MGHTKCVPNVMLVSQNARFGSKWGLSIRTNIRDCSPEFAATTMEDDINSTVGLFENFHSEYLSYVDD